MCGCHGRNSGSIPDSQRGFLHAFVKLKQMRMARADADPDYFHDSFGRKSSDAFDWKEEGAELNRAEFFTQRLLNILANLGEKTEREMNLIAGGPANAANVWIQRSTKIVTDRLGGSIETKSRLSFTFSAGIPSPIALRFRFD